MNINPLQLQILTVLNRDTKGKRYSELKPQNVENDLFNYHLQFLVRKGRIKKEDSLYHITHRGKKIMADIDALGNKYELFRFSVTVNIIKEENDIKYILTQKRKRHPYYGDIATISGKVKRGELIEDAAKRKLKEETGLTIDNIQILGLLRKIRLDDKNELVEDTVYNICYGENPRDELIKDNEYGENKWLPFDEFLDLHKNNSDIGELDREIYQRIKEKNLDTFHLQQISKIKRY